ncbi:queuosine precursor transporter [Nocardia sp. 2]|uniref:Probable queuosine precursor transporter n=1 Tax=Nocardia acididurans TaxID=2802282 RepID=A0ABS1M081_9NOCA|nr:queuosine precursor transporter [Nocardia acididurans]MBL1073455.1 queuosine precursor transporter [Nocardia acididurans]
MSDALSPAETAGTGRPATEHAAFAKAAGGFYTPVVTLFTAVLIISNICATKGIQFFGSFAENPVKLGPVEILPLTLDGAFFLFPLAYIIGDVLSEVYGFKAARRAIYFGFGVLVLMLGCFWIARHLPGGLDPARDAAFDNVLGTTPQLVLAGLCGYFVGEMLNSATLVAIKERTKEKHLWARLLGSTVVGEFGDTLIFCAIAATAIGINSWGTFFNYLIVGFVWKTLAEVLVLPITYRVIAFLKKNEPSYAPVEVEALRS